MVDGSVPVGSPVARSASSTTSARHRRSKPAFTGDEFHTNPLAETGSTPTVGVVRSPSRVPPPGLRGPGSRHPPRPLGALQGAERLFRLMATISLAQRPSAALRERSISRSAPRRCRSTSRSAERSSARSVSPSPARSSTRRTKSANWAVTDDNSAACWGSMAAVWSRGRYRSSESESPSGTTGTGR